MSERHYDDIYAMILPPPSLYDDGRERDERERRCQPYDVTPLLIEMPAAMVRHDDAIRLSASRIRASLLRAAGAVLTMPR